MRWRLTQPHYLNVPGTKWEYSEVDRKTGRPIRRSFPVPTLLDTNDPQAWTSQSSGEEGYIDVCYEGKGAPGDIEFVGEPTPDMTPLDDEAKALSASFATKWKHPIEDLPGNRGAYAESLIEQFQSEMSKLMVPAAAAPATVQVEGLAEMLAAMTELAKQNSAIVAALATPSAEPAKRRL